MTYLPSFMTSGKPGLVHPANPSTNASDLFTLTIDASSRWPNAALILSAFSRSIH